MMQTCSPGSSEAGTVFFSGCVLLFFMRLPRISKEGKSVVSGKRIFFCRGNPYKPNCRHTARTRPPSAKAQILAFLWRVSTHSLFAAFVHHPLHGVFVEVRRAFDVQLFADPNSIMLDRSAIEIQRGSDLAGGETLADQLVDFQFAIGENVQGRGGALPAGTGNSLHKIARHLLAYVYFPSKDFSNGFDDFARRFLLGDVTTGTGAQHALGEYRLVMHGQDENEHFVTARAQVLDQFDSVRVAQREIDDRQVGF